jgi:negative regulator of flagellin synthesis FlgM
MTTISDATSSPPLQGANPALNKANAGAADVNTSTSSATGSASTSGAAAATTGASTTGSTVTSISTISTQLQAVQAASSSDEVYSTGKVNEIKAAIVAGTFRVNSSKVADGLLDSVHDLLGSRQRS